MTTKIEWTQETWNPIIGCTKISEGCKNCYAEKFAYRLSHNPKTMNNYVHVVDLVTKKWSNKTQLIKSALTKPLKWKKSKMIFICSIGDLFHESVPFEWIDKVISLIGITPIHTFQILTKRPERMLEYFKHFGNEIKKAGFDSIPSQSENPLDYYGPLPNLWLGVTCENQEMADKRIPILLQIPAKVRFVSCEPLLEEILLKQQWKNYLEGWDTEIGCRSDINGYPEPCPEQIQTNKIDWVITGPETGFRKRPCKKEWIESLYEQCKSANVPFFDKKNVLGKNIKQYPI
jgi:protein gp37